jgi:hypothetical protein
MIRFRFSIFLVAGFLPGNIACTANPGPSGRLPGFEISDASTSTTSTSTPDAGQLDAGFDPCPLPELASIRTKTFIPTCAVSGCHSSLVSSASIAAGLDLSLDVAALRVRLAQTSTQSASGLKLVKPGYFGSSWLYLKLALPTPPSGEQMPLQGRIEACELDAIKTWIEDGAL